MNEIKFKAYYSDLGMSSEFNLGSHPEWNGVTLPYWHKVAKILQFTGLKDKNNKDVYKDDIIKYKSSVEFGLGIIRNALNSNNFHCVWVYQKTTFPVCYTSIDYLGCSSEIEVIGNENTDTEILESWITNEKNKTPKKI